MSGALTHDEFKASVSVSPVSTAVPSAVSQDDTLSIAYLGHDACDAAVRRRIKALLDDGFVVHGFMPRRRDKVGAFWTHTDLGETRDGAFAQRFKSIFSGAAAIASTDEFRRADVVIARNLDMLAMAFEAKRRAGLKTPVIYECLDVHRLLTRTDPIGTAMRGLERALLKRCAAIWVSSPGFLDHHFYQHHRGLYRSFLLENRLPESGDYGPRPVDALLPESGPMKLGWVGNLRCQRSFDLLLAVADRFGGDVDIHLHGQPARTEIPVFEPEIDCRTNVTFHGRFAGPPALSGVYGGLDAVWAGDFMEAGANSEWLLPNRIYEGGYFGVPPIAPASTQTAKWIEGHGIGLTLREPLEETLLDSVARLIQDRSALQDARSRLLSLPEKVFIEPAGTLAEIVRDSLLKRRS